LAPVSFRRVRAKPLRAALSCLKAAFADGSDIGAISVKPHIVSNDPGFGKDLFEKIHPRSDKAASTDTTRQPAT
jgi:hypothetical protein